MSTDILLTHKLLESCEAGIAEHFGVHRLYEAKDPDALIQEHAGSIRGIAGHGASADLMQALPRLEIVANFGVGYDGVDVDAARRLDVRVTNTPDVLNDAMAEFALGLMLGLGRQLAVADAFVRAGKWGTEKFPLLSDLRGKTVGIVGLGRIGSEIALRCQAMKMRVIYYGRHQKPNSPYIYYDRLPDLARDADWLVVVVPGGAGTRHLVDAEVLDALGPAGRLVNVARGSVVDQEALIERLADGRIAGAALDVFANEPEVPETLTALPNTLLAPHLGSATIETRTAMGQLVVDNLVAHFSGKPLLSQVV